VPSRGSCSGGRLSGAVVSNFCGSVVFGAWNAYGKRQQGRQNLANGNKSFLDLRFNDQCHVPGTLRLIIGPIIGYD
jgi:hypothetical protein